MDIQKQLIEEFNLPKYIKNKSFAEASQAIEKKFSDRKDPAAKQTMQELLERLAQAQEYVKMQEESSQQSQQQDIPKGMEEFAQPEETSQGQSVSQPNEQNKMFLGGIAGGAGGSSGATGGSGGMPGMGDIGNLLSMGKDMFGKNETDSVEQENEAVAAAGSAVKGASTGMNVAGPWGAAAGGALGIASGLIGAGKRNKAAATNLANQDITGALQGRELFKLGGYTNKFNDGGPTDPPKDLTYKTDPNTYTRQNQGNWIGRTEGELNNYESESGKQLNPNDPNSVKELQTFANEKYGTNLKVDGKYGPNTSGTVRNIYAVDGQNLRTPSNKPQLEVDKMNYSQFKTNDFNPNAKETSKEGGKTGNWLKRNASELGRLAPIANNLLTSHNLEKADPIRRDQLNMRYKPQQLDEESLFNKINQNNVNKALSESSGGDLGGLRSNILAANLNKDKAASDSSMQVQQQNLQDNVRGQEFNRGVDTANVQMRNQDKVDARKDDAMYETTKQNLRNATAENIASLARELGDKETVKRMFGYRFDGSYFYDDKGNKVPEEEVAKNAKKNNKKEENKK